MAFVLSVSFMIHTKLTSSVSFIHPFAAGAAVMKPLKIQAGKKDPNSYRRPFRNKPNSKPKSTWKSWKKKSTWKSWRKKKPLVRQTDPKVEVSPQEEKKRDHQLKLLIQATKIGRRIVLDIDERSDHVFGVIVDKGFEEEALSMLEKHLGDDAKKYTHPGWTEKEIRELVINHEKKKRTWTPHNKVFRKSCMAVRRRGKPDSYTIAKSVEEYEMLQKNPKLKRGKPPTDESQEQDTDESEEQDTDESQEQDTDESEEQDTDESQQQDTDESQQDG